MCINVTESRFPTDNSNSFFPSWDSFASKKDNFPFIFARNGISCLDDIFWNNLKIP